MSNLFLKHALEDGVIREAIDAIHDVVVSLRGSPKRRLLLIQACAAALIKYLKPQMNGATRWNSNEMMVRRFLKLRPALEHFSVNEAFDKQDDRGKWYCQLGVACLGTP